MKISDYDLHRFFSNVDFRNCWFWLGKPSDGYGLISVNNKLQRAHRVSLIIHGQTIPRGMMVDHKCRNRACVNPEHLRIVTPKINALENSIGIAAKNKAKTHCINGHKYTEENTFIRKQTDGRKYRRCKICQREQVKISSRRYRAKLKERGEKGG